MAGGYSGGNVETQIQHPYISGAKSLCAASRGVALCVSTPHVPPSPLALVASAFLRRRFFLHTVLQRLSHYQIHPPRIKERGRADIAFFFFMRLHFTSLFHSLIFCIFSLRFWNTLCGVHETVVIEQ